MTGFGILLPSDGKRPSILILSGLVVVKKANVVVHLYPFSLAVYVLDPLHGRNALMLSTMSRDH